MLTDRQIFLLIGFDTDAMEKYKYSESNAVLTPHLNCGLSSLDRVGASGRAKHIQHKRSKIADQAEKEICKKWALRQQAFLNNSVSNAVIGG